MHFYLLNFVCKAIASAVNVAKLSTDRPTIIKVKQIDEKKNEFIEQIDEKHSNYVCFHYLFLFLTNHY